ncbi:MAG TPA: response regulator [Verrucomicrobiae bacterium]|nr:response regulator [Verrucomicrobiae bacterium]
MNAQPTILFAEDSESDMMLIQLGFEKAHFPFFLQFVSDGALAIEYLTGKGRYADRMKFPVPSVLLTDLQMPRVGGLELLAWVRSQPAWQRLPVIVVTGSNQPEDRMRALELGADFYVLKDLLIRPPPGLFEAIIRCAGRQQGLALHKDRDELIRPVSRR